MYRLFAILQLPLLFLNQSLRADEGMWLLPLIEKYNIQTMQAMGLNLSADQIYSTSGPSIKDAVVIFGRGCTGGVISDRGLILTNHHCGYDAIQQHSSTTNDYLKDGFWAMSQQEEIPTPDLTVAFLVSITEVTDRVLGAVTASMTEQVRGQIISTAIDSLVSEATQGNHYTARVQGFYGGNTYYLLVYETFTDVRMVGAPPSSIGKFGADTDNWTWPRHTGDFALFRVYADSSNRPAPYSADNVPYRPKHYLPISLKGIENEDFAMILGYPGGTARYSTSWEVEEIQNIVNAHRAAVRGVRLEILLEDMLADQAIRIKYATKYARSSNYWKYSIGQNRSLAQLGVIEGKRDQEQKFTNWVSKNRKRRRAYGEALDLIRTAVEQRAELVKASLYMRESLLIATEILLFAGRANRLHEAITDSSDHLRLEGIEAFREQARGFFRDYHAPTDKRVASAMLPMFISNVSSKYYPEYLSVILSESNGDVQSIVQNLYETSIFTDSTKLWAFLDKPDVKILEHDMAYQLGRATLKQHNAILDKMDSININFNKGHRQYVAGILEMNAGKPSYPDANFSMRLTYGQVMDYYPRDAVRFNHYTTLTGVMEKEDPSNWEFVVPPRLKELYQSKDFGPYALPDGRMPVGFISNNDITGGNSGSPVLNANGHLIGCAFDGNWEAMSGDIIFEPEYQRTISVDVRYILFVIDRYAGAKHLVDEMTLVP